MTSLRTVRIDIRETTFVPGAAAGTVVATGWGMARAAVLVVDGNFALGQVVAEACRDVAYVAASVRSADAAIHHLRQLRYDVIVVTDAVLPDMDWMDFLRLVLRDHPDLPVLVAARRPSEELSETALRAGARECLTLPLTPEQLVARLVRAVDARTTGAKSSPVQPLPRSGRIM